MVIHHLDFIDLWQSSIVTVEPVPVVCIVGSLGLFIQSRIQALLPEQTESQLSVANVRPILIESKNLVAKLTPNLFFQLCPLPVHIEATQNSAIFRAL